MPTIPVLPRDQRGIALVMALLVLLVISLLAATLMMSLNVDTKIASLSTRQIQALNIAEAGVAEATARIRSGDIPTNNNPLQVAEIFNTVPGSVPVLGANFIALATKQPVGQWLPYTTATVTDSVLTVAYKTDAARTVIYKYDVTKNPAIQTTSGLPIFVITSTGRKGAAYRRVVAEVIQKPFIANVKAAMAADVEINFSGNSDICGYNHSIDTPTGTKGRPPCDTWELASGGLPGAWSSGNITSGGSSSQSGTPAPNKPNQTGFYAGPWEALGLSQADYFSWIGAPLSNEPANPTGIYYLDNNGVTQDVSGNFAYHGGDGEGLLYVDGNLTLNGGFNYRGLIYVEGDLQINGTTWILGGLIVKGQTKVKIANGNCTILYSADAISQNIAKYGGQFVTLSWRESNF
jgi:Tfp pilus assembly protein PilX